jgi:glycyl-tRNA synthetase
MDTHYDVNGLVFWTEKEFRLRESLRDYFVDRMQEALHAVNPAWMFVGIEAPVLMPRELVNPNYTPEDMFVLENLVLRPETTPGTYRFIRRMFDDSNSGFKPPLCVWQCGKSFRREQDQPSKHMRLKEFHQLEFQCVFADDTKNDYHAALLKPVEDMIADMTGLLTRVVPSDRLPDYSLKTVDVEADTKDKWMEMASISLRKDFPGTVKFQGKNEKVIEKKLLVAEVAIGIDRCVYGFLKRTGKL